MIKIIESKRELWNDIKWYYDQLINHNKWEYLDEFTMTYSKYELDYGGTLGYSRSNNPYGNKIRRLYLVCCCVYKPEWIDKLISGEKTIKDFDEDNIL